MASAWGGAWGASWGAAWGAIAAPVGGGYDFEEKSRKASKKWARRLLEDIEEAKKPQPVPKAAKRLEVSAAKLVLEDAPKLEVKLREIETKWQEAVTGPKPSFMDQVAIRLQQMMRERDDEEVAILLLM